MEIVFFMLQLHFICHMLPQTFDELIDLASRGNEENVMVLAKQLKTGKGSDVYSIMPDDLILYCFGRGVDSNLGLY